MKRAPFVLVPVAWLAMKHTRPEKRKGGLPSRFVVRRGDTGETG